MTLLLSLYLALISPLALPSTAPSDSINIEVRDFMRKWKLRGMQVCAMKDGEIVLERAYGWADVEAGQHMDTDNTLRIASVSKLFTATGIMVLRDRGLLALDDRVFGDDGILCEYNGAIRDRRYGIITVEDLLRHEGGFSQKGGDPMFSGRGGLDNDALLRRELARPLAFYPGTSMEYSNIGFLLLSMIIEKVTGEEYGEWMKANVLGPAGISDMELAGNSPSDRLPSEVRYYTDDGCSDRCYVRDIRGLSGAGAWTASASDLCRLAAVIDGKDSVADIIRAESVMDMTCWFDPYTFSIGWNDTDPSKGWTRTGSYAGTSALLWYFPDGQCWALITNTSSWKGSRFARNTKSLTRRLHQKFISLSDNQTTIQ
ncbi:MAG: beta-lactamase family protein [Bacteroidales bacterium]|nr:beta-lactamase family protein [Bacteroidales bacterium]